MRVTTIRFQLMLLAGIFWTAELQPPCEKRGRPGDTCGCNSDSSMPPSPEWSGVNSEFYFVDDMVFRKPHPALIQSDSSQAKPDLNPLFWPGGLIFYVIDESFKPSFRAQIEEAMNIIQTSVGKKHLEFRSARAANGVICRKSYLKIQRSKNGQCIAQMGGPQAGKPITEMWLDQNGKCSPGTIQHELLHSLGCMHEQSRPDRDKYVTLESRNTYKKDCGNFAIVNRTVEEDPSLSLSYDVNSIMHYGSCFFSCTGGYTMVTKDGNEIKANRKAMTLLDILKVQAMYPANAKVPYNEVYCRGSCAMQLCSVVGLFLSVNICVAMRLVL